MIKRNIKRIDRSGLSRLMPIKISRQKPRKTDRAIVVTYKGVMVRTEETLRNSMKITYMKPENMENFYEWLKNDI